MISIRCESSVPGELAEHLRGPIERAVSDAASLCDVFIYRVSPARDLMVRLTVGQSVLPILFRPSELEPNRVFATVKGALANATF
jgi:hypothetical protein